MRLQPPRIDFPHSVVEIQGHYRFTNQALRALVSIASHYFTDCVWFGFSIVELALGLIIPCKPSLFTLYRHWTSPSIADTFISKPKDMQGFTVLASPTTETPGTWEKQHMSIQEIPYSKPSSEYSRNAVEDLRMKALPATPFPVHPKSPQSPSSVRSMSLPIMFHPVRWDRPWLSVTLLSHGNLKWCCVYDTQCKSSLSPLSFYSILIFYFICIFHLLGWYPAIRHSFLSGACAVGAAILFDRWRRNSLILLFDGRGPPLQQDHNESVRPSFSEGDHCTPFSNPSFCWEILSVQIGLAFCCRMVTTLVGDVATRVAEDQIGPFNP